MRLLLRVVLVATLAVVGLVAVAPGAAAHTSSCEGTGTMSTSGGFGNIVPHAVPNTRGFTLTIGPGAAGSFGGCANVSTGITTLSMAGILTGWCDHWTGSGTASDGRHSVGISVVKIGTEMTVTAGSVVASTGIPLLDTTVMKRLGGGYGEFDVVPIPTLTVPPGNSCSARTASQFQVTGWIGFT